jgi:hypothetical protein
MKRAIFLVITIFILAGCDYFDDYDKFYREMRSNRVQTILDDSDGDGVVDIKYTYSYGELNNIIKIEHNYRDKTTYINSYSYNKNGQIKREIATYQGWAEVFNYNYKDSKLDSIDYDYGENGLVDYRYNFSYDQNGKIKMVENRKVGENYHRDINYTKYYCDGVICLDTLKYPDGSKEQFKLIYNTDIYGTQIVNKLYFYNGLNQLERVSLTKEDESIIANYNYYYKDNLLSKFGYDYGGDGVEDYSYIYSYNKDGYLIDIITYPNKSNYRYNYNSTGGLNSIEIDYNMDTVIDAKIDYIYKDDRLINILIDYNGDKKLDRNITYYYGNDI